MDVGDGRDLEAGAGGTASVGAIDMDAIERWLVGRGVPQAIFHYNATEDVLTRMVPFLVLVFLGGALAGFGDRFEGWHQFGVALAAVALLTGLAALANLMRGRRMFALPDDVGAVEIGLFMIGAPVVALVFGADRSTLWWQLLIANAVLFVIGYVVTSYGAVPMIGWGLREVVVQLRGIATLLARSLPLLLLFATFLFLNAEMWQVAHDLTAPFFALVMAMVMVPALAFVALRSPTEIASLAHFETWLQIDEICAGTDAPIPARSDTPAEAPDLVPLDDGERRNLVLLMIVAQMVQMLLVAAVIGGFFVAFGLLTVRQETILQWTEYRAETFDPLGRVTLFGSNIVVTWELFAVSGFIAAISALQFAVSQVSDELYREQFFASLETEIREVLAVRARYLEPLVASVR